MLPELYDFRSNVPHKWLHIMSLQHNWQYSDLCSALCQVSAHFDWAFQVSVSTTLRYPIMTWSTDLHIERATKKSFHLKSTRSWDIFVVCQSIFTWPSNNDRISRFSCHWNCSLILREQVLPNLHPPVFNHILPRKWVSLTRYFANLIIAFGALLKPTEAVSA